MIELGKKYRTRDGREVRIYAVDGYGASPIHGSSRDKAGWINRSWRLDGLYFVSPSSLDLIEVKPEVTVRRGICLRIEDGLIAVGVIENEYWSALGAIDITHDGEKLLKVEIVK